MEFKIQTNKRGEILDITHLVKDIVDKWSDEDDGACLVFTPHTTCGILVNEISDKDVCEDLLKFLEKQVPKGIWAHDREDDNGDAHIKANIIGSSQVIPLKNGLMQLGKYQSIGLADFDGPRERRVIVTVF